MKMAMVMPRMAVNLSEAESFYPSLVSLQARLVTIHISGRTFDYRSLGPSQQGGVSGEDMMSALEEFRRRRGVKEKVISDADTDSL